jgi:hypothetical protein
VSILPEGAFYDDPRARVAGELRWQAPLTGFPAPVALSGQIEFAGASRNWFWPTGATLTAVDEVAVKKSVFELLRGLRESLNEKNPEPYLELAQPRFQDVTAAYQLPAGERVSVFREQFSRVCGEDGWGMEEIRFDQMDPRICANGRIVECVDRNWLPTLRSRPTPDGAVRLRFPTLLAHIGGNWRIVL